jgi:hypothetical protein
MKNINLTMLQHIVACEDKFQTLMASEPLAQGDIKPRLNVPGVYLFFENGKPMYAGRTNKFYNRYKGHTRPSSGHNAATFAFLLMKEALGLGSASYKPEGSRAELEKHPEYLRQKARVAAMDVRFVEESDPVRQDLLEKYVATAAETTHNCFDNH